MLTCEFINYEIRCDIFINLYMLMLYMENKSGGNLIRSTFRLLDKNYDINIKITRNMYVIQNSRLYL